MPISNASSSANRILFDSDKAAAAAGYRPCAVCMPQEYTYWKAQQR
jgi:methylphosphotriester-DNA--protein-cysteine methyltransferase